jgi:hypothetical protein
LRNRARIGQTCGFDNHTVEINLAFVLCCISLLSAMIRSPRTVQQI